MLPESVYDRLESAIAMLAYNWRGADKNSEKRDELESAYKELLLFLINHKWTGYLDPDSQLPSDKMPKEFFEHEDKYG